MSTTIHRHTATGRERSMTATCAWCDRVRIGPDRPWIHRAAALEDLASARTHGICPACLALLHEDVAPPPRNLDVR